MSNAQANAKKPFFGWFVVAAGFIIMATCYTVFINCMSLFQPLIVSDLGISMAEYNLANTVGTVTSIIGALFAGSIVDRMSTRVLGGAYVVITAAVLVGFSFASATWQLIVLYAIVGLVALAGVRLLISIVVTNWFTRKRGFAVAFALAGSGFGSAILSPLASNFIVGFGWRPALMLLALVIMIAAFPITVLSFYNHPDQKGLQPYGAGQAAQAAKPDRSPDAPVTVAVGWKAIRTSPSFWLLVIGFVAMGIFNGAVLPNQVTNMTSVTIDGTAIVTGGHDRLWAGNVMALYSLTVVIAKIALGAVYDRFGLNAGNVIGTVACVIASVALCFPHTDVGPLVAAVSFGIGTCMGTVAPTVAASKLYGMRDLGKVSGWITSLEMAGGVAGSLGSGLIFDATHSFAPMWIVCAVCSVLMLAGLLAAERAAVKLGGTD